MNARIGVSEIEFNLISSKNYVMPARGFVYMGNQIVEVDGGNARPTNNCTNLYKVGNSRHNEHSIEVQFGCAEVAK